MGVIIGLDVGSSTTKVVALDDTEETGIFAEQVSADDQLTSLFGAVGRVLHSGNISMDDIDCIALTGVGGSFVRDNIFGIPTVRETEIRSMGAGGLFLSGLDRALVCSMGTGTTFVTAGPDGINHVGGLTIGGGTLVGLSARLLGTRSFKEIYEMACRGSLDKIDSYMKEISLDQVSVLPANATACCFGKMKNSASNSDVALGIFNMLCQNIAICAVFAARNYDTRDIVITGTLGSVDIVGNILRAVGDLYGYRFIIHENAQYATAAGAATLALKESPGKKAK